jgi:hypothetical protein
MSSFHSILFNLNMLDARGFHLRDYGGLPSTDQQWPGFYSLPPGSCSRSREEEKLAHLAGNIAGDGALLRPCQRLVHVSAFQYPESTQVLLGLGVRPVGDEDLAVGLGPYS